MKKMYANKLKNFRCGVIIYRNYCYKLNEKRVADFPSTYISKGIEQHWNEIWEKHKYFYTNETKVTFKMILPPPNVTGFLHLGHALTVTIQDVLARWHRMKGDTVLWVPGLDHAGIATQAAVEKYLLATKNITRHDLGREQFLNHLEQWKIEKSSKINNQLKSLGTSLDWSKEYFTMSKTHNNAVIEALIILNERNLLYRKCDLVNWCPSLRSTISDIEIEFLEINTKTDVQVPGYSKKITFGEMADVAYRLKDSQDELIVSTTRVESMFGDVAIAVHPDDSRYSHYIGKQVWHPLRKIFIPVIHDLAVKPDFGTGVLKITPAHDRLDFEIAQRNNLQFINVIDEDGKMTNNSKEYAGQRRFEARKNILNHLSNLGALKQIKNHPMSIPICSRTGDIIEYLVKEQWFLKTKNMAERALYAVKNKQMKIVPEQYETLWFDKLNNIHDWCISRQLWWGHRIPAYNCTINNKKHWIVARNSDHARELFENKYGNDISNIEQDNDVLDTWFSAALLPITAMGWPDTKYSNYYPLDLMETGHDITFYWVARMAMLSTELTGIIPFKEILLHGIICDGQGKKMSKSRGNVILPEYIIDGISRDDLNAKAQENFTNGILNKTELKRTFDVNNKMFPDGIYECGVDALRLTLCSHNIKNEKINFNVIECRTNKFFCNKIWQACRYVLLVTDDNYIEMPEVLPTVDQWILSRLTMMVENVNEHFEQKNFYKAIATIKQFFYYEFCDFYLEATKPTLQSDNSDIIQCHRYTLIKCLDVSLRIIAPIMPYLSEQLYLHLAKKLPNFHNVPSVMATSFPIVNNVTYRDYELEIKFNEILKIVLTIRNILSHINKKSISEVHIVLNNSKNMDLYLENVNLIIATTKIKNIKIFTVDNYNIQNESVCTNEPECKLYYLLTDNDTKDQIKTKINNKRLQIEQKLEELSDSKQTRRKIVLSNKESDLKIEKRRNNLQQELQKYPEFV